MCRNSKNFLNTKLFMFLTDFLKNYKFDRVFLSTFFHVLSDPVFVRTASATVAAAADGQLPGCNNDCFLSRLPKKAQTKQKN